MKKLIIKSIVELFTKVETLEDRISSSNDTNLDDAFEWCASLESEIKNLIVRVDNIEKHLNK